MSWRLFLSLSHKIFEQVNHTNSAQQTCADVALRLTQRRVFKGHKHQSICVSLCELSLLWYSFSTPKTWEMFKIYFELESQQEQLGVNNPSLSCETLENHIFRGKESAWSGMSCVSFLLLSGHCLEDAALAGAVQLCSYNSAASFYPLNDATISPLSWI